MVSMHLVALALALGDVGETALLDFQASWCAPCRSMDGTIAELEQSGYPVRKVDIDHDKALAVKYNVQRIPCFVLVVDGREAGRITGPCSRSELAGLFTKAGLGPSKSPKTIARGQSPDPPAQAVPGRFAGNPLSPGRPHSAAVDEPSPGATANLQDLVMSSVRLAIEDARGISRGSGTLIDARQGEALVLTCGHIFRDSKGTGRISVDLFGPGAPQSVPGRLVSYDDKNDVGLVSIRPGVPVRIAPVAPAGQRIAKGDRVVTVGCNNGGPATALETKVTDIDKFLGPPNLQVAGLPVEGRSGGGLFNADGLVIGVCNAADPADNEGLYAALASIHNQLDRAGLSAIYTERAKVAVPAVASAVGVPEMPAEMPQARFALSTNPSAATGASGQAAPQSLTQLTGRADGAEVICIVRSLTDPRARSEVIKLDRASSAFLDQLSADRQAQDQRRVTTRQDRAREVAPSSER
jgi:hypothetical protein